MTDNLFLNKTVQTYLILDYARENSRRANEIRKAVDGLTQFDEQTMPSLINNVFELAVLQRDSAAQISQLAALLGDHEPFAYSGSKQSQSLEMLFIRMWKELVALTKLQYGALPPVNLKQLLHDLEELHEKAYKGDSGTSGVPI